MLEISSIMKFPNPLTSDPDLLQFCFTYQNCLEYSYNVSVC